MRSRPVIRNAVAAALALTGLGMAATAQARDVHWSIGINAAPGVYVGAGNVRPVIVAPAPVYVAPAPVYVAPPPPPVYYRPYGYSYYVQPAPVYYGQPIYYNHPGQHGYKVNKHWKHRD